ncbi:MAG: hypothetical protein MJK13_00760 [Pseudomonadales bacterium]|nr:hypothetical protein [Pseudomonadales bacterium]
MSNNTDFLVTATLNIASDTVMKLMENNLISLDDALSIFKTTCSEVEVATKDAPEQTRKDILAILHKKEEHCKWRALESELKKGPLH